MPPRSRAHTSQKPRSHTAHTSRITLKQQRTQSPHTPLPSPHDTSPDPCHPSVTDTQNPQDLAHPQKHTPTTPHSTHTQQHSNSTSNPRTPPQQLRAQLPAGLPLPVTQATHAEKHSNSARNPTTAALHPEGKNKAHQSGAHRRQLFYWYLPLFFSFAAVFEVTLRFPKIMRRRTQRKDTRILFIGSC